MSSATVNFNIKDLVIYVCQGMNTVQSMEEPGPHSAMTKKEKLQSKRDAFIYSALQSLKII